MAKKVEYWFDPFEGVEISGKIDKKAALEEIADFLKTVILSDVSDGVSPVSGAKFPKLNKKYADTQKDGDRNPNLELSGDMLSSLIVRSSKGGILVTVPESEQEKADGHNNFSGKSNLPLRQFIPKKDESYEKYSSDIRSIIEDFIEEE